MRACPRAVPATGLPIEAVTFGTTPCTQIHLEVVGLASHDNRFSGRNATHGTLDQQVSAFGQRERSEIYLHCISALVTNVSITPNRSTAAESCV